MIIFKDPENRVGGWVVRFKKPGKPVIIVVGHRLVDARGGNEGYTYVRY